MLEFKEYNTQVCKNLLEEFNYEDFENIIKNLHHDKYSVSAARAFIKCTEEYDPELDESTALKRMDYIYKNRHKYFWSNSYT